MSYADTLHSILYNDPIIQGLVDSFVYSSTTYYMIFSGSLLPTHITTDSGTNDLTVENKTINHYNTSPIDRGEPYTQTVHTIACRASNEVDALSLQAAAADALNRVKSGDNTSYYVCSLQSVIPPADETDNYNATVEVTVKTACIE